MQINISPFLNALKLRLNEYKERNGFTYFHSFGVSATEGGKYFKVFRHELKEDGGLWYASRLEDINLVYAVDARRINPSGHSRRAHDSPRTGGIEHPSAKLKNGVRGERKDKHDAHGE